MKSTIDCLPCFVKQAVNVGMLATNDPKIRQQIMKEALKQLSDFDLDKAPVEISTPIQQMIAKLTGNSDPYKEIKEGSNRQALELLPFVNQLVGEDFDKGVQMLAIFNIIDFGPFTPSDDLKGFISKKMATPLTYPTKELKSAIDASSEILYLADNCGEIIYDLQFISKFLADKKVYLALRSHPILNDITMDEIGQLKLADNVTVIDSGVTMPGAVLSQSTEEFRQMFKNSPLIIAKGQGNYEALSEVQHPNLFFILIVKCRVIAKALNAPLKTPVIAK